MGFLNNLKLTGPQTNSLRVVLLTLEESLDEIVELCDINEKKGALYLIKNNLSEQEAKQVKNKITDMKRVIAQLTKQLNLKKEKNDTKRIISSHLSLLWENLCSIDSKGLRGYGDVDESVKTELDPVISRLIKSVEEILNDLKNF